MASESAFPVIDVSKITTKYLTGGRYKQEMHLDQDVLNTSKEIFDAFTKYGFIYLKGHNIDEDLIQASFQTSQNFFLLEKPKKNEFSRDPVSNWGYVPFNVETFEKTRPFDLKECFNMYPLQEKQTTLNGAAANFWDVSKEFYQACKDLS